MYTSRCNVHYILQILGIYVYILGVEKWFFKGIKVIKQIIVEHFQVNRQRRLCNRKNIYLTIHSRVCKLQHIYHRVGIYLTIFPLDNRTIILYMYIQMYNIPLDSRYLRRLKCHGYIKQRCVIYGRFLESLFTYTYITCGYLFFVLLLEEETDRLYRL